ncbi:hypothetical protein GIV75_29285 [Pseudomonas sp. PA-3-5D]|uniref:hypothetical protein n=4 Tax=Pseudomonas TaxID=286 RepID=UPI001F43F54E|nr:MULTISPECIES: hypothetical protein [unclassified Pseudomonas]MCF5518243.1 hypothetical protein [Pseudomonas sp. PA-3-6E]MCF5564928.1 hypothetical protein [Pseudomonas sp. PA-3-5D]
MKISAEDKAIKELISLENKFWQVDKDEVFSTSIAEYFGVEVLTPSKVATRLLEHKEIAQRNIKEFKEDLLKAGRFSRKNIQAKIKRYEHKLSVIESRLDMARGLKRYELIAFHDGYDEVGPHYVDSSYEINTLERFNSLLIIIGLTEVDEVTYDDLSNHEKMDENQLGRRCVDYKHKINKHMICIVLLSMGVMSFLNNNEMNIPMGGIVILMLSILPCILRRYIKPELTLVDEKLNMVYGHCTLTPSKNYKPKHLG